MRIGKNARKTKEKQKKNKFLIIVREIRTRFFFVIQTMIGQIEAQIS